MWLDLEVKNGLDRKKWPLCEMLVIYYYLMQLIYKMWLFLQTKLTNAFFVIRQSELE